MNMDVIKMDGVSVEISESVTGIEARAFDGCQGVTVYGMADSEAARIAALYGFTFSDPGAEPTGPETPVMEQSVPVELPFVQRC